MLKHKAVLNYGYSAFRLEILEYCNFDLLIEREQYYIELLKPEYNILPIAGSSLGFKHSSVTLEKMKKKIRTPKQLAKLRNHLSKLNSYQFTDDLKTKLREGTSKFNRLTKSKKVIFTEIETGFKLEFNSWREASIKLKISRNTIKKKI
jgi:group I intron endonuclease